MPDASAAMSREQKAAAEFNNAMSHVRSRFERTEDRSAVDALTEAALRFGNCELRMRRSERLNVIGLSKAEAKELAKSAMAENEMGLAALSGIRPLVDRLSTSGTAERGLAIWRKTSPRVRKDWCQQVADLDVSASEARQLVGIVDEVYEAIDRNGVPGLGAYLTERLDELEKIRRSENRGTQAASFPYWKIVMAAILWGIGISMTIDLLSRGAPWYAPFLVWLLIAIVTFCVALGC